MLSKVHNLCIHGGLAGAPAGQATSSGDVRIGWRRIQAIDRIYVGMIEPIRSGPGRQCGSAPIPESRFSLFFCRPVHITLHRGGFGWRAVRWTTVTGGSVLAGGDYFAGPDSPRPALCGHSLSGAVHHSKVGANVVKGGTRRGLTSAGSKDLSRPDLERHQDWTTPPGDSVMVGTSKSFAVPGTRQDLP